MKKFFCFLFLSLFFCNLSYSDCLEDIDDKMQWIGNKAAIEFTWKNTNDKSIIISMHGLKSIHGSFMIKSDDDIYLKPFGIKSAQLYTYDLNTDVAGKATWSCRYGTKVVEQPKVDQPKTNLDKLLNEKNKKFVEGTGTGKLINKNPIIVQNPIVWVVLILFLLVIFIGYISRINSEKKFRASVKKIKTRKNQSRENFLVNIWEGNETLSKTFWTYVFFGGIIVGVLIGFVGAMTSQLIYLLGVAYTIWSCVGLWRSSTNYKLAKIRAKQPYGWATAAKVYAVFNIITWLSQLGFILSGTM